MNWKIVVFGAVVILVFSMFLLGVQQQPDVPASNGPVALQDFEAKFTVQAPFSTATVTVLDEGLIRYWVDENGKESMQDRVIEQAKAIELKRLVLSSGFMQLSSKYDNPELADATRYSLEVQLGGASKKVECMQGRCPPEFKQVENLIRELWGGEIVETGV